MTPEQQALWARVEALWALAVDRDEAAIRASLHPDYAGWDVTSPAPHDREYAVRSVVAGPARIAEYHLVPLRVDVYGGVVGVAHYTYSAVVSTDGRAEEVVGRWTEVYLSEHGEWIMISVHGGPTRGARPSA